MRTSAVQIRIERTSGFFNNLGEPASLQQLPTFRKYAGLVTPRDDELFAPYMIETHGKVIDFLRRRAADLKKFFSDVRVLGTQRAAIKIAVNELHCPRALGASAESRVVRETEESDDCVIEVLGIGGGDEFKTIFSVGHSLKTEGSCVATVHSLMGLFELCELDTPDGQVRRFPRLKELDETSEITEGIVLSSTNDACQTTDFGSMTNAKRETIDLRQFGEAELTKTLEIEVGFTWTSEAKIKLEDFGINIGATYRAKKNSKTKLEYFLARGYKYLVLKPNNQPNWLWRVEPPQPPTIPT